MLYLQSLQNDFFRAAPPSRNVLRNLEYLAGLAGTWVGNGFSLIALPDEQNHLPFRLKLNATKEILTFRPIGAPIPNRGSKQGDIAFLGLHYFQQVSDDETNEALHLEPGLWLAIPPTQDPEQGETVVRLSTIPHGNTLLAQGPAPYKCVHNTDDKNGDDHGTIWGRPGPPKIGVVDAFPFVIDPITNYRQDLQNPQYLLPYLTAELPDGIPLGAIANPNLVLTRELQRQAKHHPGLEFIHTVQLNVSANPLADIADIEPDDDDEHCCKPEPEALAQPPEGANGAIANIPFLLANADATSFAASFWIETLKIDGNEFIQLQYSQTAILDFGGRKWPHITVATLAQQ